MAPSRFYLNQNVTVQWPGTWSELIAGAPATPVTAPAVPATTVPAYNNTGTNVVVTVTGGSGVSAIAVNGTTVATSTPATVLLPYPGTIAVTYSTTAPTWTWQAAELPQSGSSSMTAAVSGTAPPGGQAGTIPSYTFQRGMVITADSSAIPAGSQGTGDQQLYQALIAAAPGCLSAWRDGTDVVGHAALSN